MADCPYIKACPFFNDRMKDTEGMGKIYKNKYCLSVYAECARYMVCTAKGKEAVPVTMYPNMLKKAQEIIAE